MNFFQVSHKALLVLALVAAAQATAMEQQPSYTKQAHRDFAKAAGFGITALAMDFMHPRFEKAHNIFDDAYGKALNTYTTTVNRNFQSTTTKHDTVAERTFRFAKAYIPARFGFAGVNSAATFAVALSNLGAYYATTRIPTACVAVLGASFGLKGLLNLW